PLLKESFIMLAQKLRPQDRVSIVTYAGSAGVALQPTPGYEKGTIINAIKQLQPGGGTYGSQGIVQAYDMARKNFLQIGNNRVILATDGDFNLGFSNAFELERLIEQERKSGIFLTVLGVGAGNYKDSIAETLADKGNGNYAYIDTINEAKKALLDEFAGTIFTIAKDVKLQVEFNPQAVKGYRLIGYENRMLADEDFNDDKRDAGELGAGHTVTALYEIIPSDSTQLVRDNVDPPRYQKLIWVGAVPDSNEFLCIKLRYKEPDADTSKLIEHVVTNNLLPIPMSKNFRWAAAVAEYALVLKESKFKGNANYDSVLQLANGSVGPGFDEYRAQFIQMVRTTKSINPRVSSGYQLH
ncbi:MAG: DUF3520 domain-containing protein, partial [Cyanobacteria bacterium]|nr:DUF3520 domain-containing protein [Cyanobacteriota bacterium]